MPSNGSARSAARYYPSSATEISELSETQQRLKLARHSPCTAASTSTHAPAPSASAAQQQRPGRATAAAAAAAASSMHTRAHSSRDGGETSRGRTAATTNGRGSRRSTPGSEYHTDDEGGQQGHPSRASSSVCDCRGYRPPPGVKVKSLSIHTQSASALDDAQWGWDVCACGHDIESHGGVASGHAGDDDFERRAKAALRMDELLEDSHKLMDFEYDDEDLASLRKQVLHSMPSASTPIPMKGGVNGSSSLKRKSRSPAESRLSSAEPSLPSRETSMAQDSPSSKRRRMQARSQTASRAATPSSQAEGQGHGKKPSQSQKGLPRSVEEVDEEIAERNERADDESDKLIENVQQDNTDVDRLAKGVSLDTEGMPADAPSKVTDDLDESAPPVRERPAVIEERSGLIQFRVVTNDGKPESMIVLTGLKNIFQRQLPKMPREYITRLVMDRNHCSMAIVKRGLQVVGGITYRPFNRRRFAEIVFCAITSTEQVKGYGSHLMNHLKDHVKSASDVMHFLTYADNYAIGYFKKQGFSKEISLDRSVWVGYIKDYEGGTLMQCSMLPRIEYLKAQETLAAQRQLILSKIRSISKSHIIYPGLGVFKEPRPKQEESDDNSDPTANFRIDPSEVPGLRESAWTVEMDELSRRPRRGPHHNLMRHVLVEMSNHQAAWPFANPVNAQEVPDYYEVIKEPMDLSTMEVKLENNQYASLDDLLHDAHLIFDNCRLYNPPTSVYAKSANRLERFVKDSLQAWKQQAGIL